jgi:hypothetical protein
LHSDWWLGGRDDVVEGVWEWSSTGKPFSVSDWNPGQPYNLYQDQDCLRIWKKNMIITGMTVAVQVTINIFVRQGMVG